MAHPERTTVQVYRDCLRLVRHMAGHHSPKAQTLRAVVRTQFRANMYETNEALAKQLRERAEKSLSQYLFYERTRSDPKFKQHLQEQAARGMMEGADVGDDHDAAERMAQRQSALDISGMAGVDRESILKYISAEQDTLSAASDEDIQELIRSGAYDAESDEEDDVSSDEDSGFESDDPYADPEAGDAALDAEVSQFVLDAKQRDALAAADAEKAGRA